MLPKTNSCDHSFAKYSYSTLPFIKSKIKVGRICLFSLMCLSSTLQLLHLFFNKKPCRWCHVDVFNFRLSSADLVFGKHNFCLGKKNIPQLTSASPPTHNNKSNPVILGGELRIFHGISRYFPYKELYIQNPRILLNTFQGSTFSDQLGRPVG